MRLPVLLLALTATAATAQPRRAEPPRARPLNEMPAARPVLTVYRTVDGHSVMLVKEGGRIVEERVGRPDLRRVFTP